MVLADAVGTDLFRAVLQGAPPGAVYALIALGFVLAYKTSGVFNLAFGAQAYVSSLLFFKLHVGEQWGIVASFVVSVVVLAPLIGFVLEWVVFRNLRTAPAVAKLVITIGLSLAIPNIADLLININGLATVRPTGIAPRGNDVFYDPFGVYGFSRNELVTMGVALAAVLALGALFRYSALGLRMRAVVESPRLSELNGIAADHVSAFSWALSSLMAGLAGVLIAPKFNGVASGDYFNIVIVAIAAAAIGRLVSLPRALAGGLGLGVLIALFNTFLPRWSAHHPWLKPIQQNVAPALPFVVLFGLLVFVPSIRRARESGDPLAGLDPPPATVSAATDHRSLPARLVGPAVIALVLLVVFTRADSVWLLLVTQAVVMAVVYLSITVVTGHGGLISLCQCTYGAIGGFAVYQLSTKHGLSCIVAALVGAAIAAAVGAVLSIPVRRLSGIWVAIATLAFAFFFDAVVVKLSWVGPQGGLPATVPRPQIGPWNFTSDKSFLALALVLLVLVALAVNHLAKGTIGQQLQALRGSELAAQSIGISPARLRMAVFAISAFIAGLGGAFLAIQQQDVNYANNFSPFAALFWLVLVVTIGARKISGAVGGAAAFSLGDKVILQGTFIGWILRSPSRVPGLFPISAKWRFILFGLATIQFARHPEGPIEMQRRRSVSKQLAHAEIERRAAAAAAVAAMAAATATATATADAGEGAAP